MAHTIDPADDVFATPENEKDEAFYGWHISPTNGMQLCINHGTKGIGDYYFLIHQDGILSARGYANRQNDGSLKLFYAFDEEDNPIEGTLLAQGRDIVFQPETTVPGYYEAGERILLKSYRADTDDPDPEDSALYVGKYEGDGCTVEIWAGRLPEAYVSIGDLSIGGNAYLHEDGLYLNNMFYAVNDHPLNAILSRDDNVYKLQLLNDELISAAGKDEVKLQKTE